MICRIPMLCISVGFAHLVTESDLYIQFAFEAISLIKYFDIYLVLVNWRWGQERMNHASRSGFQGFTNGGERSGVNTVQWAGKGRPLARLG